MPKGATNDAGFLIEVSKFLKYILGMFFYAFKISLLMQLLRFLEFDRTYESSVT